MKAQAKAQSYVCSGNWKREEDSGRLFQMAGAPVVLSVWNGLEKSRCETNGGRRS